jgi:hypothetical protein
VQATREAEQYILRKMPVRTGWCKKTFPFYSAPGFHQGSSLEIVIEVNMDILSFPVDTTLTRRSHD